jgi:hypothetical protein
MTDTDPLLVARRYFGSGDPSIIRCACKVGFSVNSPQPEGVRQAKYRPGSLTIQAALSCASLTID